MTSVKVVQPTNQQTNQQTDFKVGHRSRSRSQVNILYDWKALVTRNLYAKYKGSSSNGSQVMTNVKVVQATNQQTNNQQTDRAKTICPRYRYRGYKNI